MFNRRFHDRNSFGELGDEQRLFNKAAFDFDSNWTEKWEIGIFLALMANLSGQRAMSQRL